MPLTASSPPPSSAGGPLCSRRSTPDSPVPQLIPTGVATQFKKLEQRDGTGSINDLLREGHAIPGIASRIPEHEVFDVGGQDNGVYIFDVWYARGTTGDHDPALTKLVLDLYLTPLTRG